MPHKTESRLYEVVYSMARASGQTIDGCRCPFCESIVEAYRWSLAGSGKRCECGAGFHFHPRESTRKV